MQVKNEKDEKRIDSPVSDQTQAGNDEGNAEIVDRMQRNKLEIARLNFESRERIESLRALVTMATAGDKQASSMVKLLTRRNLGITEADMAIISGIDLMQKENETTTVLHIDIEWLKESLKTLQSRKLSEWRNDALIARVNKMTGMKSTSVSDAIANLNLEQAEALVKSIKHALDNT